MRNLGTTDYLDQGIAAEPGDIIYCTEDNKVYQYYDEGLGKPFGWKEYEIDKNAMLDLGLTEYDINKMIIAQLPALMTDKQLAPSKELIKEFTHNYILAEAYYMLLCNELRYYTIFHVCNEYDENVEDIILECLKNIGVIQQINKTEKGDAIECWVKNDKGTFMFMLFNYDEGVISCR